MILNEETHKESGYLQRLKMYKELKQRQSRMAEMSNSNYDPLARRRKQVKAMMVKIQEAQKNSTTSQGMQFMGWRCW